MSTEEPEPAVAVEDGKEGEEPTVEDQPTSHMDLYHAVTRSMGKLDELKELLEDSELEPGALDGKGPGGWTPINSASFEGYVDIVKYLLVHKANIEIPNDNGYTPLNAASFFGHAEVVKVLLAAGADVTTTDQDGKCPLKNAKNEKFHDVVALLQDIEGANVPVVKKPKEIKRKAEESLGVVPYVAPPPKAKVQKTTATEGDELWAEMLQAKAEGRDPFSGVTLAKLKTVLKYKGAKLSGNRSAIVERVHGLLFFGEEAAALVS
mmetsp:Transcript_7197/g.13641  ORF Transcript_7197/g.13641 Transcript_7197/m.13641 type:complete len:264 (+) Transcript_7197:66-857(+)|eukprot:CAMPEP_0175156300 /NCGR_PEP_ID=MMETSP0087-20121206/21513_1 /TAXON_ID=136419 /ORGANISM="Unknown Unknown, Strain D1" /LENGTH=263 /DNA_ID=CAMNT_0016443669 /DNA_START=37 /DNA_END=828 /DNA_ORIENTATION=-